MNRSVPLHVQEAAELQTQFALCTDGEALAPGGRASDPVSLTGVSTLLEREYCLAYLDGLAVRLGVDSRPIAASMLSKRYAALAAVPFFYALTCYDKALELPLESVLLRSGKDRGDPWLEGITVRGSLSAVPAGGVREPWRYRAAERFVRLHLTPLWEALSRYSGISEAVLWENTAVRIYSLYEKKLPSLGCASFAQIADDLRFLLHELPAEAFGWRRQPFAQFFGGSQDDESVSGGKPTQLRVRKTCCLHYCVSGRGDFCAACPRSQISKKDDA